MKRKCKICGKIEDGEVNQKDHLRRIHGKTGFSLTDWLMYFVAISLFDDDDSHHSHDDDSSDSSHSSDDSFGFGGFGGGDFGGGGASSDF